MFRSCGAAKGEQPGTGRGPNPQRNEPLRGGPGSPRPDFQRGLANGLDERVVPAGREMHERQRAVQLFAVPRGDAPLAESARRIQAVEHRETDPGLHERHADILVVGSGRIARLNTLQGAEDPIDFHLEGAGFSAADPGKGGKLRPSGIPELSRANPRVRRHRGPSSARSARKTRPGLLRTRNPASTSLASSRSMISCEASRWNCASTPGQAASIRSTSRGTWSRSVEQFNPIRTRPSSRILQVRRVGRKVLGRQQGALGLRQQFAALLGDLHPGSGAPEQLPFHSSSSALMWLLIEGGSRVEPPRGPRHLFSARDDQGTS